MFRPIVCRTNKRRLPFVTTLLVAAVFITAAADSADAAQPKLKAVVLSGAEPVATLGRYQDDGSYVLTAVGTWETNFPQVVPVRQYKGRSEKLVWLPTEKTARLWQAFTPTINCRLCTAYGILTLRHFRQSTEAVRIDHAGHSPTDQAQIAYAVDRKMLASFDRPVVKSLIVVAREV